MANKVVTGILVLLVILMGGIGYYTYALGQQLTAFETGQTARVDAITDELVTLRTETASSINALEGKIGETLAEIDTLQEELGATQTQIAGLESAIGGVTSQVESMEDRLDSTVAELSRSAIDASEVYQKVSQATVRISDGQNTIGSGIIFNAQGHVLTAHHVADSLSEIYVMLYDGRISRATTVGSCQFSDIAVLKLEDNPDIEPPPLADSSNVKVGEPVAAIGSPLDLRDTLTAGIISQVNRFAEIQYDTQTRWVPNLFQFDAAVNSGNSGGPLASSDGEVIGIVIARISPLEGDGIYWAVSSSKARRVATAIIEQGSFDYPWIGVGITDLTPQIVQEMALETANGVLIRGVFSGGPAEAAGIKVDDIIVSLDAMPVTDSADLTSYLGEFKSPGDAATIGLIRGSTEIELSIEVGKREE